MEIDINDIDFISLRRDLRDYFGTAVSSNPFAMADVINIDSASDLELLNLLNDTNLDITNYIHGESLKKILNK